jgi:C4-dicarboxylate transporter DctM subunit
MPLGFALLGAKLGARCASGRVGFAIAGLALAAPAGRWRHSSTAHRCRWCRQSWWLLLAAAGGCADLRRAGRSGAGAVLERGAAAGLGGAVALPDHRQPLAAGAAAVHAGRAGFRAHGAAQRLGDLFLACSAVACTGTVLATAVLCSAFTAFTGGSGVTILALGGLLLPLLRHAGYPEQRGIGLVTSASALGVLLAPSVPLIMYAVIARVPITTCSWPAWCRRW